MASPRAPAPDDDIALLALQQRFQGGDRDAFGSLVEPHLDAMYTVCLRMLGRPGDAEDIVQEALARALERHALYRPGEPLRPWMLTIALNLCRSRLRTPWWRRVLLWSNEEDRPTPDPDAEAIVGGHDRDSKVRAALLRLPPIYREALSLFFLEDMPYTEMSRITGEGIPALKQRVRRGKEMLKATVEKMYPEIIPERTEE